jgi:hypothetical protein
MKILAETGGHVVALAHQPYADEEKLEGLLAQYPELALAGTSDDEGVRIWTIGRQVGVPSGAIDLLLLDSTGHVWVVETKLEKNPQVRKHVVGQVLAYASDVATWGRDDLEHVADTYLAPQGGPATLRELLATHLDQAEADDLVDRAVGRLSRGDLTALIVVDELNTVLRRLVEFVNSHATFNLLALKIETVTQGGTRLFIPTVVGATTAAPSGTGVEDTETFDGLLGDASESVKDLARRLDDLASKHHWEGRVVKKSKGYWVGEDTVVRFFPKWESIIIDIGRFRRHGLGQEADRIQALAAQITGRPQGAKEPGFGLNPLLANWNRFTEELLPLYLDTLAEYRQRKEQGG